MLVKKQFTDNAFGRLWTKPYNSANEDILHWHPLFSCALLIRHALHTTKDVCQLHLYLA